MKADGDPFTHPMAGTWRSLAGDMICTPFRGGVGEIFSFRSSR